MRDGQRYSLRPRRICVSGDVGGLKARVVSCRLRISSRRELDFFVDEDRETRFGSLKTYTEDCGISRIGARIVVIASCATTSQCSNSKMETKSAARTCIATVCSEDGVRPH